VDPDRREQQPSAAFRAAATALSEGEASASARPLHDFFDADGVSVSTLGTLLTSETVSATTDVAARLDEWQFDLGEGPCWDAVETRRPVHRSDFSAENDLWPAFRRMDGVDEIGSLSAFPLLLGPLGIGAIELYTVFPRDLEPQAEADMVALAAIVSRKVLRRALRDDPDALGADGDPPRYSRRAVHQATGVVLAQLGISPADAALLIQGRAFSEGRSMHDVAVSILDGRISFRQDSNGIEDTP
jgi:hypothetical protein